MLRCHVVVVCVLWNLASFNAALEQEHSRNYIEKTLHELHSKTKPSKVQSITPDSESTTPKVLNYYALDDSFN